MVGKTFRDVLGEPSSWSHSATSTRRRPDMRDATVQSTFCSGSKVSVATHSIQYGDTLSVFNIPKRDLRERVLRALRPGASVAEVLETPI